MKTIDIGLKEFNGEIIAQNNDAENQKLDVRAINKETKRVHTVSLIVKDKTLVSFSCPCQLFVRSGHLCCHLFRAADIALVNDFSDLLYCWRWKADYTRPAHTFARRSPDDDSWWEEESTCFDRCDESRLTKKELYAILKGSGDQLCSSIKAACKSSTTSFKAFQKAMNRFAEARDLIQTLLTDSVANPNVGRRKGRSSNRRIKSAFEASSRHRGGQSQRRSESQAVTSVRTSEIVEVDEGKRGNFDTDISVNNQAIVS